jgi:hypothetical protein
LQFPLVYTKVTTRYAVEKPALRKKKKGKMSILMIYIIGVIIGLSVVPVQPDNQ